jgi:hypothetical protein
LGPNLVEVGPSLDLWKGLEKKIYKMRLHSPFEDLKHKLLPNEWLTNKLVI